MTYSIKNVFRRVKKIEPDKVTIEQILSFMNEK